MKLFILFSLFSLIKCPFNLVALSSVWFSWSIFLVQGSGTVPLVEENTFSSLQTTVREGRLYKRTVSVREGKQANTVHCYNSTVGYRSIRSSCWMPDNLKISHTSETRSRKPEAIVFKLQFHVALIRNATKQ